MSLPAEPNGLEILGHRPGRNCMVWSDFNRIGRLFAARLAGCARGTMWMMGIGLLAAPLLAQTPVFPGLEQEIPEVLATFEARMEPATARPGEHVRLIVTGRIAEGWYTYSLVPQDHEFAPPPTTLAVKSAGLELQGPVYETNPVLKMDKVAGIPLAFHPKSVRFYQNKVRIFYLVGIFLFIRWGTFELGALWVVGFFLGENVLFGLLDLGGIGSGVAYWAHLAGLVFGIGAGFGELCPVLCPGFG